MARPSRGTTPLGTRLARLIALLLITGAVLGLTGAAAMDGLVRGGMFRPGYASDDLLVILAIGSDKGPPMRPGDPTTGLADGIHLFVVDTAAARMTVVDLPRDLAIGGGKVNRFLAQGGPQRLEDEIEAWSGLPIDFHLMGSFQSVEAVTHSMGGITIDVPHRQNDRFSGTDLQPGPQTLTPSQALAFTRDRRSLSDGDIGRSANQTRLMLAALAQVRTLSADNLQYVVNVVATLRQHTVGTIPAGEMVPLAMLALRIQPEHIEHVTITGPFGTIGGGSVIIPQPGNLFARLSGGQVGPQQ